MSGPDDKSVVALDGTDVQPAVDPDVVEFALVLSRTIDSLEQQPDQMRQALYELARYKLNDQLRGKHGKEFRAARSTLETAIEKVERFYEVHGGAGASVLKLSPPTRQAERGDDFKNVTAQAHASERVQFDGPGSALKRPVPMALRLAAVLGVMVAAAIAIPAFRSIGTKSGSQKADVRIESPVAATTQQQPPVPDQSARRPDALLPSHFGAFAVGEGKLVELRLLRGAVPDPRVAISAAIREDSEAVLPDGKLKFIIYRRDLPGSMPTRADVRVIARVKQFQAGSAKSDASATRENHWVIRNIAFPYRIAPIQGAPDMYEIESEAPDFTLAPGRYALVWKGIGYDFTVAGDASSKHCLEQIAAANGVFYSECR